MTSLEIEPGDRSMILAHYYRAMVGRADVWRMRMDTTTNWAIGATAAVVSFTLGNPTVPHYVVWIASAMTVSFLLLEARRLTFYNLWQSRVLMLEVGLIHPALAAARSRTLGEEASASEPARGRHDVDIAEALDGSLGTTVPSMSRLKAVARRLRRVYLYLFGVQLFAWGFKLANHPEVAGSVREFVARAGIAAIPGEGVVAAVGVVCLAALWLGLAFGGVDRDPA
jgi:uncharacterized membrane protein